MTQHDAPVIIEAALNRVTNRERNANVPATAEERAKDALACVEAGATIVHTHAPNIAVPPDEAADAARLRGRTPERKFAHERR
jgi:uncharacterized protein (DUF849 family)